MIANKPFIYLSLLVLWSPKTDLSASPAICSGQCANRPSPAPTKFLVRFWRMPVQLVVVVVVMTSPSGTPYMGGQRGPEEMRNSTRLWILRDPSLPRGSWQPFINWGTTQGRLSLPTADVTYCQPLSNNRCWRCRQTVNLQSVLRLCSGFYRSKDPTNSIKVLKEVLCNYSTSDYVQLIMDKTNTADLSSDVFTILLSATWMKITKFIAILHILPKTSKQWHNKGSTELYCLFIGSVSIVYAISFIRRIAQWS